MNAGVRLMNEHGLSLVLMDGAWCFARLREGQVHVLRRGRWRTAADALEALASDPPVLAAPVGYTHVGGKPVYSRPTRTR